MINSDDIERNGYHWTMVDEIAKTIKENPEMATRPFIINTDSSDGTGVHWIACVITKDDILVYDPLGMKNERMTSDYEKIDNLILSQLRDALKYLKRDPDTPVKIFRYQNQYAGNTLCGYHSLYICSLISKMMKRRDSFKRRVNADILAGMIKKKMGSRPNKGATLRMYKAFTQSRQ